MTVILIKCYYKIERECNRIKYQNDEIVWHQKSWVKLYLWQLSVTEDFIYYWYNVTTFSITGHFPELYKSLHKKLLKRASKGQLRVRVFWGSPESTGIFLLQWKSLSVITSIHTKKKTDNNKPLIKETLI